MWQQTRRRCLRGRAAFCTLSHTIPSGACGSVRLRLVKQAAHAHWHFLNVAQLEADSLARLSGTHSLSGRGRDGGEGGRRVAADGVLPLVRHRRYRYGY